MIYLDNASTSFPKPAEVVQSIQEYLNEYGVSPGRGSYKLADKAEDIVTKARHHLADMLGADRENHLVFTQNATHSLNIVIQGFLKDGDHVLICSYSHNSVIRPIDALKRQGKITYDIFEIKPDGSLDLQQFKSLIKPNTRLVIGNHASNVIGVVSNVMQAAAICQSIGIHFLLDCTQSLGYVPINVSEMPIDFLAGTGHKTLMGPSGVGFLYLKNHKNVDPLLHGGSGGNHSASPYHPSHMPHKFEAGTLNTTGIAGLYGGIEYIRKNTQEKFRKHSMELIEYAWNKLAEIDELILYGTGNMDKKVPIISFNIGGTIPSEVAHYYGQSGICLRAGLQCAPLIHKTLGTLPTGTLRISPGHFNCHEDIDRLVQATKEILMEGQYAKTCA